MSQTVLLLWCLAPSLLVAQSRSHFGSGYMLLASDTLGVEQFVIRGDTVIGVSLWREGGATLTRYRLTLDRTSRPLHARYQLDYGVRAPMDSGTVQWDHARGTVTWRRGDSVTVHSLADGAIYPLVSYFADYLVQTRRLGAVGASESFRYLQVATGALRPARATRTADRRYRFESLALRDEIELTPDGGLRHLLSEPTKIFMTDSEPIDREGEMRRVLERDNRSGGIGTLSPRDSVAADFSGMRLAVNYGSPARRGRTIWGDVVEWGRVWRAGANLATHLTIDRDVVLGGQHLTRGTYTLWILPTPAEWLLIVNAETGQWGTRYDAAADRLRVPMTVERASDSERLRYFVETRDGKHVLGIAWGDRRAFVPIAPAPSGPANEGTVPRRS